MSGMDTLAVSSAIRRDRLPRPVSRGYCFSMLRSGVGLNSRDRCARLLETSVRQRVRKTSGSLAIGHWRLSCDPECCHGNMSVTLGQVTYAPLTAGKNGASHSVSHSLQSRLRNDGDRSSSPSLSAADPSSRVNLTLAGISGLGAPSRIPIATATAGRIAKTFSVLRAPMLSPCRSMIHSSSNTSRILRLMPANPGPRR